MKSKDKKKKLIIEAAVIGAILLAFAIVVIVNITGTSLSVSLTVDEAQSIIDETVALIPFPQAKTAMTVVEGTDIKVESVENGDGKEIICHCVYETFDTKGVYEESKESIFANAYEYYITSNEEGIKVNATKIRLKTDKEITELLETHKKIQGEVDIYIYELEEVPEEDAFTIPYKGTILRAHLNDEMVNTVFGGLVDVRDDISNTTQINYNGEVVDIEPLNTLRRGLSDCFGLQNFSSDKPDTSPYFLRLWNEFCDEFYRNFIQNAQWKYLARGLVTTLEITLLAALFGILLGFICAIIRVTHDKTGKLMVFDQIVRVYLSVVRGTPVMIQLLIIYFVLLLPAGVAKFPAAVICFALNSGAYVAEIVRGGIMSVDNGQIEAGRSLGLNYIQTMYHIVVPQAFKAVLPSLANEFITLLKESSVAFYIGVADLTQGGLKIRSITYSNFMPLIAVAVIYFVIVMIMTKLVKILERRLRKDER